MLIQKDLDKGTINDDQIDSVKNYYENQIFELNNSIIKKEK